ncbi:MULTISPECIES: STM4012 family radical SAM protein [unclassified Leptolyngbya]|uniref:STM4012 family radical SAM protein n=1 Tax=unclassified Leptolyngbya TaxID=2650499 RepID=UPI00168A2798|nr:STM4012 family radical SAM protein [Leptolyngbya sp. FACHB-8]MBD1914059.1 STM4012 family radical SAM protein [Leptolyngbya sp. FACHB-8]MBD2152979.1 STM4012 family radical SAM protein [Leptolyngbya sp. FACHB-16]
MLTTQLPLLTQSPYQAYVYSYPHKTAYRPFPDRSLNEIWSAEKRDALFLYIHIPFCEMRCGFCNLFTTVNHSDEFVNRYVTAVQRQAKCVKAALGDAQFARFALGGGTPTQLPIAALETILNVAEDEMGASLKEIPVSVEVSPETATTEKLQLLRDRGADRISIGVQSFIDSEVLATQRRQTSAQVQAALTRIRETGFPTLNLDLIYGLPGQTVDTWLHSIRTALQFHPEEIYFYPLYVRPLTGLGLSDRQWDDIRLACYRAGRDLLRSEGYTQVSMRMFRRHQSPHSSSPVYCCQADGMIGLGCGARSYTRSLHYSNDYAVNAKEIRSIIEQYITSDDTVFDRANYGFDLNREEQQRRFILLSLLSEEGLDGLAYRDRFSSHPFTDFPALQELIDWNLAHQEADLLALTDLGVERSDAIGPWLFSEDVRRSMQAYELK